MPSLEAAMGLSKPGPCYFAQPTSDFNTSPVARESPFLALSGDVQRLNHLSWPPTSGVPRRGLLGIHPTARQDPNVRPDYETLPSRRIVEYIQS
jgi:hypothetical protein